MVNALKGEVPLKLDGGRKLTLVFDMDGLIEAEGTYGKPLAQMLADASAGFMGAVRAMLFGALRARHSDLTLGDVSAMLADNTQAISDALGAAYSKAMPDPAGDASAEGKAAPTRQRGKTSGDSGAKRDSNRKASTE